MNSCEGDMRRHKSDRVVPAVASWDNSSNFYARELITNKTQAICVYFEML